MLKVETSPQHCISSPRSGRPDEDGEPEVPIVESFVRGRLEEVLEFLLLLLSRHAQKALDARVLVLHREPPQEGGGSGVKVMTINDG